MLTLFRWALGVPDADAFDLLPIILFCSLPGGILVAAIAIYCHAHGIHP